MSSYKTVFIVIIAVRGMQFAIMVIGAVYPPSPLYGRLASVSYFLC